MPPSCVASNDAGRGLLVSNTGDMRVLQSFFSGVVLVDIGSSSLVSSIGGIAVCVCVCVCTCMCDCMCVCMHACMLVHTHMCQGACFVFELVCEYGCIALWSWKLQ